MFEARLINILSKVYKAENKKVEKAKEVGFVGRRAAGWQRWAGWGRWETGGWRGDGGRGTGDGGRGTDGRRQTADGKRGGRLHKLAAS